MLTPAWTGFLTGLLFPIFYTFFVCVLNDALNLDAVLFLHTNDPLMWLADSVPLATAFAARRLVGASYLD